ncbi:D-alanyl-D-alanine carboxypeptidase [Pontimicrobium sp. SW4]|uniref:D-alanyl-D-alanine carboxypeptidase n=1 Tax=Pontimicrobium sp. SW4 TaxID=3153519 RepID=A0AAU7BQX6_9FLAO
MKVFIKLFLLTLLITVSSCSTTYKLKKDFNKHQKESEFFKGFVLYNPETRTQIINHNGSKFFTPASNTKLYTFYSAYKTLGDSLKGLEYYKNNDTLFIKGAADPSFLYEFEDSKTIPFLNSHNGPIVILDVSLDDNRFGNGWSWEDYQYYYMPERSLFPMYGNVVTYAMNDDSIVSHPSYFKKQITVLDSIDMNREFEENKFYLERLDSTSNYIPFKTSTKLIAELLSDTLSKPVNVMSQKKDLNFKSLYSIAVDSVYKQMLVVSDNFIAEQLMLQVAKKMKGTYNVEDGIEYILENHLQDLPQKPVWRDGSGLSVYNLFSPEDTAHLLTKMYQEIPLNKLLNYFPVGGESGTLRNWYGGKKKPYVYAKSGTLSNTYCLSGYVITKKGTVLVFSYMNNNYNAPNSKIRSQIQDHLSKIYEKY